MKIVVGLQVVREMAFARKERKILSISALWLAVSGFKGGPKAQG
jgi:hypothetical protein